MQLPVLLGPPGIGYGQVIIRQELLVVPRGQNLQDLHRIVWVVVMYRLRCHGSIIPHPSRERVEAVR